MCYNKASEGPLFAPSNSSQSSDLGLALGVLFLRLVSARSTRVPAEANNTHRQLESIPLGKGGVRTRELGRSSLTQ